MTDLAVLVLDVKSFVGGLLVHGVVVVALDVRVDNGYHAPPVGRHLRKN